jgi:hypothetical protein
MILVHIFLWIGEVIGTLWMISVIVFAIMRWWDGDHPIEIIKKVFSY